MSSDHNSSQSPKPKKRFSPDDLHAAEDLFQTLRNGKKRKDITQTHQTTEQKQDTSTHTTSRHRVKSELPTTKIILVFALLVLIASAWSFFIRSDDQEISEGDEIAEINRDAEPNIQTTTPIKAARPSLEKAMKTPPSPRPITQPKKSLLQLNNQTVNPTQDTTPREEQRNEDDHFDENITIAPQYDDFKVGPREDFQDSPPVEMNSPRLTQPINENDEITQDVINPDEFQPAAEPIDDLPPPTEDEYIE